MSDRVEQVDMDKLAKDFTGLIRARDSIGFIHEAGKADSNVFGLFISFFDGYTQWRYENRGLARLLSCVVFTAVILLSLVASWFVAPTSFGQSLGLDSVRDRFSNAYYAALWITRSAEGAEHEPVKPKRYSGAIEKVIDDVLVVVYYDGGKQKRALVRPANVITTDRAAFKTWAMQYHLKGLMIDLYDPLGKIGSHEVWAAVMWYRKVPINVEMVEQGIGYPEKNPPTAVVNKIFSMYYWQKATSNG